MTHLQDPVRRPLPRFATLTSRWVLLAFPLLLLCWVAPAQSEESGLANLLRPLIAAHKGRVAVAVKFRCGPGSSRVERRANP